MSCKDTFSGLWSHATNSRNLLDKALTSKLKKKLVCHQVVIQSIVILATEIKFIEADVSLGRLIGDKDEQK